MDSLTYQELERPMAWEDQLISMVAVLGGPDGVDATQHPLSSHSIDGEKFWRGSDGGIEGGEK